MNEVALIPDPPAGADEPEEAADDAADDAGAEDEPAADDGDEAADDGDEAAALDDDPAADAELDELGAALLEDPDALPPLLEQADSTSPAAINAAVRARLFRDRGTDKGTPFVACRRAGRPAQDRCGPRRASRARARHGAAWPEPSGRKR